MTYRSFKLPHLHPIGATYSILLLVNDAVPRPLLRRFNEKRISTLNAIKARGGDSWKWDMLLASSHFDVLFDELLYKHRNQEHPFANPMAAQIMVDTLTKYHGDIYDLNAYSVMSNHVHAQLDFSVQLPLNYQAGTPTAGYRPLNKAVQLIKGGSAYLINKHFGRKGTNLWPKRYRDRFIRGEDHLWSDWRYTLNNPKKAGLVIDGEQHAFTGGLSYEEMMLRQSRRIYPFPGVWYEKLAEFDKANPGRNRHYNARKHGL